MEVRAKEKRGRSRKDCNSDIEEAMVTRNRHYRN